MNLRKLLFGIIGLPVIVACLCSCSLGQPPETGEDKHPETLPPGAIIRFGTQRFRQGEWILALATFPKEKRFATVDFHSVRIWDSETGVELTSVPRPEFEPSDSTRVALVVAPNEAHLLLNQNGILYLYPVNLKAPPVRIKPAKGLIAGEGFMADQIVALTNEGMVEVRDGKGDLSFDFLSNAESAFLVANDKAICTATKKGKILVHPEKGETLTLASGPVERIALSRRNGVLASAGFGSDDRPFLTIWTDQFKESKTIAPKHDPLLLAVSANGDFVAAADPIAGSIDVWRTTDLRHLHTHHILGFQPTSIAFGADDKSLVASGMNGVVWTWNTESGRLISPDHGHRGPLTAIRYRKNELVTAGTDGIVRFWDVKTHKGTNEIDIGRTVKDFIFSRKEETIYVLTDEGTIRVVDIAKNKEGEVFPPLKPAEPIKKASLAKRYHDLLNPTGKGGRISSIGRVEALTLSPDGKTIAIGGMKGFIELLDVESAKKIVALDDGKGVKAGTTNSLIFVSDTTLLSRDHTGRIRIWDLGKRTVSHQIEAGFIRHPEYPADIALSPDGKQFASPFSSKGRKDSAIGIWNLESGELIQKIPVKGGASAAAYLDAKSLLIGDDEGTTWVWDADKKEDLKEFKGHRGAIRTIQVSPDRRVFATGGMDTTVLLWTPLNK